MKFSTIRLVYFSPTHTSRQVVRAVARGYQAEQVIETDLTYCAPDTVIRTGEALVIVAVPVYGGRVAETAVERLKFIKGDRTPVVPIVVYGNRDYEDALRELSDGLEGAGFIPLAAGAFIGEHSYSRPGMPIAAGRPDRADENIAIEFGKKIAAMEVVRTDRKLQIPGNFPYKVKGPKTPAAPMTIEEKCIRCGLCAGICPTAAISGELPVSNTDLCIKCCACVKECPVEARVFDTPYTAMLFEKCSARREPDTWLSF